MKRVKKGLLTSPVLAKKRRKRRFFYLISFFVAILALCVGVFYLFRLSTFLISGVEVKGEFVEEKPKIEEFMGRSLEGSKFLLLPKNNRFVFSKDTLREKLIKNFPRIDSVVLEIEEGKLIAEIKQKEPVALWCNEKCFFMDESGFVFSVAPEISGSLYPKFYGGIEGEALSNTYSDIDALKAFFKISDSLKAYGLKPTSFIYKNKHYTEIKLFETKIFLNPEKIDEAAEALKIFLSSSTVKEGSNEKNGFGKYINSLEYIDLRFGSKVYFK